MVFNKIKIKVYRFLWKNKKIVIFFVMKNSVFVKKHEKHLFAHSMLHNNRHIIKLLVSYLILINVLNGKWCFYENVLLMEKTV